MVDTLLLCASEDLELHDGTPGREYLMNVQLMVRDNVLYCHMHCSVCIKGTLYNPFYSYRPLSSTHFLSVQDVLKTDSKALNQLEPSCEQRAPSIIRHLSTHVRESQRYKRRSAASTAPSARGATATTAGNAGSGGNGGSGASLLTHNPSNASAISHVSQVSALS